MNTAVCASHSTFTCSLSFVTFLFPFSTNGSCLSTTDPSSRRRCLCLHFSLNLTHHRLLTSCHPQQTTGAAGPCGVRAGPSRRLITPLSTTTTPTAPGLCWPSRETPSPWFSPTFSWRTTTTCWRSAAPRALHSGE